MPDRSRSELDAPASPLPPMACEHCKKLHPNIDCGPAVRVNVYLPGWVYWLMRDRVPLGKQSSWLAGLAQRDLTAQQDQT